MITTPAETISLGQLLSAAVAIFCSFGLGVLYGWALAVVAGKNKK